MTLSTGKQALFRSYTVRETLYDPFELSTRCVTSGESTQLTNRSLYLLHVFIGNILPR